MAGNEKNTSQDFQDMHLHQLLVIVRYKPGNAGGMAGAESMLGGVAGAASAVSSAVDSATSYVPGFIKEEKGAEKKSDKDYTYYKEYGKGWDKILDAMDKDMALMNEKNKVLIWDYEDDSTADKRKSEGQKLYNKINSEIAGWSGYSTAFHFVGLGQGGNIANEAASLLKDADDLKKGKWAVKSLIYIGTPLYRDIHTVDPAVADGAKRVNYGSRYDLTQQAIQYFEPADKLRKYIETSNSDLFSYFTGNILLHLIKALAFVLGDHKMGTGEDNKKVIDAFDSAKNEITSMIEEMLGLVKKLIDEVPGMISLDEIPEFANVVKGYDAVPGKAADRISRFVKEDLKKMRDGFGISTDKLPIEKFFNCIVPVFNALTDSLNVFQPKTPAAEALAKQILEKAGVTKVYAPAGVAVQPLDVDEEYIKILQQKAAEKKPEQAAVLVGDAHKQIQSGTKKQQQDIGQLDAESKAALAGAIGAMTLPMLPTKKALYAKLLSYLPLSGANKFLETLTGEKAAGPLKSLISNVRAGFDFDKTDDPDPEKIGLGTAITRFDGAFSRVKGYLDSKQFPIDDSLNSLYFIYNSHNLVLKQMHPTVRQLIDQQTGLDIFMQGRGYEFDVANNNWVRKTAQEKENVKAVQPIEEKEPAAA